MLVPSLLVSLVLAAPPKPGVSEVANQKKLAAECVHPRVFFPPASILRFESAKAAYERFEALDVKGQWHAPGAVRMDSEVLFLVGLEETLALTSVDDIEPDDKQEDSLEATFANMDIDGRFITLRWRLTGHEVPSLPTDREPTPEEKEAHRVAKEQAEHDIWYLALVDRSTAMVLGATQLLPLGVEGQPAGTVKVVGDEVRFLDDLDEGPTVSLAWLERCALLEEDAAARAEAHIAQARAATKRAKGPNARKERLLSLQQYDRALGISAKDSSVRVERAAVLVELAQPADWSAVVELELATRDLDIAAKYPEDLTAKHQAELKRLRKEISRLMREASIVP